MHSLQAPAPPRAGHMRNAEVSGFAPQLHPHGTSLTAPQLLSRVTGVRNALASGTCAAACGQLHPHGNPLTDRSCFEGRPKCAMHSLQAHAPPRAGHMRNAYGVGVCTAVASPREPPHCTAVALRGDRSACIRFKHQRRRVRAICAMQKCRGLHRSCIPTEPRSLHRSCFQG